MPTMIKLVRDRAEVTDNFKLALKHISKSAFASNKRELDTVPSYVRDNLTAIKTPILRGLARVCTLDTAFDEIVTRLRTLPYAKYEVKHLVEHNWLSATTRPILAEGNFNMSHRSAEKYPDMQTWDMGPYEILVRLDKFVDRDMTGIHMIPLLDPTIRARHMHHHFDKKWIRTNANHNLGEMELHTSDYMLENPKTCWGNFPNLVSQSMADGDVVEFLRILHIFLSRLNPSSPLENIENMTFAKRVTK